MMRDISSILKEVYATDVVALVPEGGTFAMEAVIRHIMVDSGGWFCAMARFPSTGASL